MLAIETRNLQKRYRARVKPPGLRASLKALARSEYREVDAVRGVNLAVERGETLACIGPNGAGKSTLIKMLTGILYPSDGEARVLSLAPQTERQALSRRIGAVFGQKSLLWYHLPAADSFELLGAIYDLDRQTLKARTQSLVREFELEEFFLTPVRKLSLGQRMRCEIAASLLHAPELLFLDEPTIGLDVVAKRKIRECILRMNHAQGVTGVPHQPRSRRCGSAVPPRRGARRGRGRVRRHGGSTAGAPTGANDASACATRRKARFRPCPWPGARRMANTCWKPPRTARTRRCAA